MGHNQEVEAHLSHQGKQTVEGLELTTRVESLAEMVRKPSMDQLGRATHRAAIQAAAAALVGEMEGTPLILEERVLLVIEEVGVAVAVGLFR